MRQGRPSVAKRLRAYPQDYFVAFCGACLTRGFPFIPGALHGPSRSRPSGLRRSVAGCALTPSTPASSRYLLSLCSKLCPAFFGSFPDPRSRSCGQDALLHADDFALRRAAQCFCSRTYADIALTGSSSPGNQLSNSTQRPGSFLSMRSTDHEPGLAQIVSRAQLPVTSNNWSGSPVPSQHH